MPKLTLTNVAQATGGRVLSGQSDTMIAGVSTDSRSIASGELFIPLQGEHFDGHLFFDEAIRRGASAVLVQENNRAAKHLPADFPVVAVADTLIALQDLAVWHRSHFEGPVVAVTGSNGKTTTKDMVASVLSQRHPVLSTIGNLNTEIGLSLTLLQREANHAAVVVEMGMRGLGQIAALVSIARPTVGIVTNVGPVHLELLGTLDAVTQAKGELVAGLPHDGVAIINADDPRVMDMVDMCRAQVMTCGLEQKAAVYATDVRVRGFEGIEFRLWHAGKSIDVQLPLPGKHNVSNALAAAAAGLVCGLDLEAIARGLGAVRASGMRMQIERLTNGIIVLNDAYNAAPASMQAALEAVSELPAKRRIAVLGDMLELGSVSEEEHAAVGKACAALGIDQLIAVGPLSRIMATAARSAGMQAEAITAVANAMQASEIIQGEAVAGDVVLVKASRGMELERVIDALKTSEQCKEGGTE